MITEDYVSFEVAKLLKENGFDAHLHVYYSSEGLVQWMTGKKWMQNKDLTSTACIRPTLQMATKWLREVHHLFIECGPRLSCTDFYWISANIYRVRKKSSLYHTEDVDDYNCVARCDSHSYEEACDTAIKYCLENLI